MNKNPVDEKTNWKNRLKWRKIRLCLVLAASFVVCLILSFNFLETRYEEMITPQISRAFAQIANMLPQLDNNSNAVRQTWDVLTESRKQASEMGIPLTEAEITANSNMDDVINGCFAIDRLIQIKVGHSGSVIVARQDNGEIIAHPNKKYIGNSLMVSRFSDLPQDENSRGKWAVNISQRKELPLLDLNEFLHNLNAGKFDLKRFFVFPSSVSIANPSEFLHSILAASIVPCEGYYVVCGVDGMEYLSIMGNAVLISLLACVMLGLFVYYICLMLDRHEDDAKTFRKRLVAYTAMLTVAILGMSWYIQVLSNVTADLKAMNIHSEAALNNLKSYRATQKKINDWLDEQYLLQCRVAAKYVKSRGRDQITRQDLSQMSHLLGVQHIYVYDQTGTVAVTNSPYDHLRLSENADDPSYAFRALLEGADHVTQPPVADEVSGARAQFIGVGLRSDADLADGFVMVSIDPALRDGLIDTLSLEKVLDNMIIGLPEHALAIDKNSLNILATTGPGRVGQPIADLGVQAEAIKGGYSGFLELNDEKYYASFSDAGDLYLMPVVKRTENWSAFTIALRIALIELAALLLIVFLTLYRYQEDVVDSAPAPEPEPDEAPMDSKRKEFEKRWGLYVPASQQTPGERVKRLTINLALWFSVLNVIPYLCFRVLGTVDVGALNGLTYVVSGKWEKGVNIFALSSCVFLLLALYALNIIWERALYKIASISNMRVETICLMLRNSLKYVCVIAFIYYGLSEFGIPTQALLASAGILTLAVSMGAKDFVNDMIAGFFVLMEGHVKVGDFVSVGSWKGTVQQIGIRTTRIVSGHETKIVNNSSLKDVVNADGEVASLSVKIPADVNANLIELEEMLKEELPKLTEDVIPGLVKPVSYVGVTKLEGGSMELTISASVKNGMQSAGGRALNRQVKLLFERRGIEIPVK